MTQGAFSRILARYGQDVTVYTQAQPQGIVVRAFFQPMRDKGTQQTVPSPLGLVMQDRFLCLGPPEARLDDACRVNVRGDLFRAQAVQPVYVGDQLTHWWAVFTRRAREVVE